MGTFINPASCKAADLLVDCLATSTSLDSSLEVDSDILKAIVSCKDLIYFLWAASKAHIEPTVTVQPTNCHILTFVDDLHDKHILPSQLAVPNPDDTTLPSTHHILILNQFDHRSHHSLGKGEL